MQPLKVKFTYNVSLNANNSEFPAIKRVHGIISASGRAKAFDFSERIHGEMQQYKTDIANHFLIDFKDPAVISYDAEIISIDNCDIQVDGSGKIQIPNSSESYDFDIRLKLSSAEYTCVSLSRTEAICYGNDRKIRFIRLLEEMEISVLN